MGLKNDRQDKIFVNNVPHRVTLLCDDGTWFDGQVQQALLSAEISWPTSEAGFLDAVDQTLDYSKIYASLLGTNTRCSTPLSFAGLAAGQLMRDLDSAVEGYVEANFPKFLALTDTMLIVRQSFKSMELPDGQTNEAGLSRVFDTWLPLIEIKQLKVFCIVGIGHLERRQRQPLSIDITLTFEDDDALHRQHGFVPENLILEFFKSLPTAEGLVGLVEKAQYKTLEAVAHNIAKAILTELHILRQVTVKVIKPAIFSACDGPGVSITRKLGDFIGR